MAGGSLAVKDAVYRLQNYLLDGTADEAQLFAAGSIMSRADYGDVVTERSIANLCGYPLCSNPLPSDRPRKGRYRISLKEHKVYDLHETHMYCSSGCVVHSRAFAGSLQEERSSALNPAKLDEVLRLFGGPGLEEKVGAGDLGISKLKIQEKEGVRSGDVSVEQWAGPSNAVEGYVPQREQKPAPFRQKARKEGLRPSNAKPDQSNLIINDFDFVSSIITSDEYSVSKLPPGSTGTASSSRLRGLEGESREADSRDESGQKNEVPKKKSSKSKRQSKSIRAEDAPSTSNTREPSSVKSVSESGGALDAEKVDEKSSSNGLKSSLKSGGAKKVNHSVTWADKKDEHPRNGDPCDVREIEDTEAVPAASGDAVIKEEERLLLFSSAEACAMALTEAAEATAAGQCVSDAVSDAGLIILPPGHDLEEEVAWEDPETVEVDLASTKWPRKTTIPTSDMFESEDSWFDAPPEGFSLTLSPFATMWNALFSWVTSSSVAYVYGQDESFQEDYLSVNGRAYPQKVVLSEGRSSEIKQTLAGCLARALPGLVADLRLPIPISTLEQGLGRLLDTMSFLDSLPSFRVKQWQVVLLLFMDALSVSCVPALTPHMTNWRALLHKVLDGAQIGVDEYELMKDLLIPLGRAPRFSAQCGA